MDRPTKWPMKTKQLIAFRYNEGYVFIDPLAEIKQSYPQIVVEELTNGEYSLFQIDTINDIDNQRQCVIAAQWNLIKPLPDIPTVEIKNPDKLLRILEINVDENLEVKYYFTGYKDNFVIVEPNIENELVKKDFLTDEKIEKGNQIATALLSDFIKEFNNPEHRGCPCTYLEEPCHPQCTCVNGLSSVGCQFCCTYGSIEQRTAKANYLAEKLRNNNNEPDSKMKQILNLIFGNRKDGKCRWWQHIWVKERFYEQDNEKILGRIVGSFWTYKCQKCNEISIR